MNEQNADGADFNVIITLQVHFSCDLISVLLSQAVVSGFSI